MNNDNNRHWNSETPQESRLQSTTKGIYSADSMSSTINIVDSRDKQKSTDYVPQIKIYSKKVYEPYRIDPEQRKDYHNKYGEDPLLLIFSDSSCKKLKGCIGWGTHCKENRVEQGGILLGRVFRYQQEIFSFVEDVILANTRGKSAFVEFTPDMWAKMQQDLDEINHERKEEEQLSIIGWFHTHPNGLSVFMSGTDKNTQDKNFFQDWQVSIVLNPHTRKLRAFFGTKVQEGKIVNWKADISLYTDVGHSGYPLHSDYSARIDSDIKQSSYDDFEEKKKAIVAAGEEELKKRKRGES